jgi:hypothetical protein
MKYLKLKLVPLADFSSSDIIFCRGCDKGRYAYEAARDLRTGDVYCGMCSENHIVLKGAA